MENEKPTEKLDESKRRTLRALAGAAWVAPVVATYALSNLSVSSAWAQSSNSTSS